MRRQLYSSLGSRFPVMQNTVQHQSKRRSERWEVSGACSGGASPQTSLARISAELHASRQPYCPCPELTYMLDTCVHDTIGQSSGVCGRPPVRTSAVSA